MRRGVRGRGLINKAINALPFELHLLGYNYCGPGTRLQDRLSRGDKGINPLDEACKEHDIAYHNNKDVSSRLKADQVLADKAWARYNSKDVPWGEKAASWLVTSAMNTKTKIGGRIVRRKKQGIKKIPFSSIVNQARLAIRGAGIKKNTSIQGKNLEKTALFALKSIRKMLKNKRKNIKWKKERVLPLPKSGGVLPLLPIFAGLSAIGSLAGGAAGIAKTVAEIKDARKQLSELQRHNKTMEAIALRQGKGLYLKPFKKGLGLYMTPYVKQAKNL